MRLYAANWKLYGFVDVVVTKTWTLLYDSAELGTAKAVPARRSAIAMTRALAFLLFDNSSRGGLGCWLDIPTAANGAFQSVERRPSRLRKR